MLATVKNYDFLCYQSRNNLYVQLDNPLKKELDKLSKDVKEIIISSKRIGAQDMKMLEQIFNFRVKAIKWLSTIEDIDFLQMLNDTIPEIEEISSNKKLGVLSENILFALRCNQRVVESLMKNSDSEVGLGTVVNINKLPEITYSQLLAALSYAIPDDEAAQKMADWINASLHIEFVLVAADIISDDNLKVSDRIINDLAFLVADSAQLHYALAMEFGIITPISKKRQTIDNIAFDKEFIEQQKQWADCDVDDYAKTLPPY